MDAFIKENWMYLAIAGAILFLYEVQGLPLFFYLLNKFKGQPQPQPAPQQVPAMGQPQQQVIVPAPSEQPPVKVPPTEMYSQALGVTLLGSDFAEMTIKREQK
jgi:hypothetical protein